MGDEPLSDTIVTSTIPVPGGAVAVIVSSSSMVKRAGVDPKKTCSGKLPVPTKRSPVMVTTVPPFVDPKLGERLVTIGGKNVPLIIKAFELGAAPPPLKVV